MSAPPRFSVIIPAFNAAGTVSSAIDSVLAQTTSDLEVVVVDDGSTDGTGELVGQFADPRIRLISQSNRGLPAARNAGIAAARAEYVAFLDSDDLLLPDYLELSGRALRENPGAGFAYTDAYVFDDVSGRVRHRSAMARNRPPVPAPTDRDTFLLALLERNFVFVAVTAPKPVLDTVGGFDESRTSSEDYELWLRIVLRGYRAAWVPGRHALYRKRARQMSRNLATMSRNLADVYEGLSMQAMPTPAHRELLARRRRDSRRAVRVISPLARMIPLDLITALRRAGVGEAWYDAPPADVAAAFPDLTAV
jgi:glycosyltransferase involved in cell wall biosynthesis